MIHEKPHLHDTAINYITLLSCGGFQLWGQTIPKWLIKTLQFRII